MQHVGQHCQHNHRLYKSSDIHLAAAAHATKGSSSIHGGHSHEETPQGHNVDEHKDITKASPAAKEIRQHAGSNQSAYKIHTGCHFEKCTGIGSDHGRLAPPFFDIIIFLENAGADAVLQQRLHLFYDARNHRGQQQQKQCLCQAED